MSRNKLQDIFIADYVDLFCWFIQNFIFFRKNWNAKDIRSRIFPLRTLQDLDPRITPNNFSLIKMQPVLSQSPPRNSSSRREQLPSQILIPNSWLVRGRINRRSLRVSRRTPFQRLSLAGRLPSWLPVTPLSNCSDAVRVYHGSRRERRRER